MKDPTSATVDGPVGGFGDRLGRISGSERARLRVALLRWYRPRSRPFRFRATQDSWGILVSEVMAQQTQVARVDPAWVRFMQRFPTPVALAESTPADVLRSWAGLGYNRRAVQLQRAARLILERHQGHVPGDIEALEALPGIGPYTARAVAAVAFGQPLAAVDTNVRRVVTRLVGEPMSERDVQAIADGLLAVDEPADWTHAIMDLGATVCRPRSPDCELCPIAAWCASAGRPEMPSGSLSRAPSPQFERTTRWLRGQIVATLREAPAESWTRLPLSIGSHGPADVAGAVAALERDGIVEQRPDGALRLPSVAT